MLGSSGGKHAGMCRLDQQTRYAYLERLFPSLKESGYCITSPPDSNYNCVTWAVHGARNGWIWPSALRDSSYWTQEHFWPRGLPRTTALYDFVRAFSHQELGGFVPCSNGDPESGLEKLALYVQAGRVTHVARHLEGDWWTSKIGADDDITHRLEGLQGKTYGMVAAFLKRSRRDQSR